MAYIAKAGYRRTCQAVGNGQCVSLVKSLTGAPPSSLWRAGESVASLLAAGKVIPEGTAIATFFDGRYPNLPHGNHAALFVRATEQFIEVFDQWKGAAPAVRRIRFGLPDGASRIKKAEMYSVVL